MKQKFPMKQFLKQIAVIAVPVALQNLLTTTGSMVDTMMLAVLGENTVGAVGLCAQFSSLMFSCYWGFVGGGMLFFAQYFGAKDDDGINRSYGITLTFMMMVGFVFCLLGVLLPETVMRLYTDKAVLQEIGADYLRVVGFAYPLMVYSMAMASLLRTTDMVRVPLIGAICSVAVNITLNAVLIPKMGVQGAATATVAANLLNVLVILGLGKLKKHAYLTAVREHFRWTRQTVKKYLQKCFPIICNELLIGVGNMVINIVLGRQPEQAIAALAVMRTLEGLVIGFFAGFSNASSVLVGTEVGAGHPETAYRRALRLVYLCMAFIALTGCALMAVNHPLLHVMGLHDLSYEYGFTIVLIYCAAAVIRMGNWTKNDTFRAAGDATTGTVLEITFMYLMVLPAVCLSGLVWKWAFPLVFLCCYIDEPIRFVIMHIHLYSGKWIRPVTDEGIAAMPEFRRKLKEKH